ncbi:MAG: carboxypeptidase-like regulatory domain-containing protein, partial [Acidobacterium ailaaui]|nr:carboxypeptidase-like regulatory domain-containing protein [Pseudacidobacterium ailaaui]
MTQKAFLRLFTVLFCLTAVALNFPAALGQATATASITGMVTDQTGAAVAGAKIVVTNNGTNAQRETTSNGSGEYR